MNSLRFEPGVRDFVRVVIAPWISFQRPRERYRLVLEFRWLADNRMTLEQLGERFGLQSSTMVQRCEYQMAGALVQKVLAFHASNPENELAQKVMLEHEQLFRYFTW